MNETPVDPNAVEPGGEEPRRRSGVLVALPVLIFAALAALFLYRLETGGDPSLLPSVLIGKPVPDFDLKPPPGITVAGAAVPGLASADLKAPGAGRVTVVNFWASWCVECRVEHEVLKRLAKDPRVRLVGIAYKDAPADAARWLRDMGNPYGAIGVDERGRVGIDWGVYGVPETYVVDARGVIVYKHIGPISDASVASVFGPRIDAALRGDKP